MTVTPYPMLRLKLTVPQALQMRFLPAIPGAGGSGGGADKVAGPDTGISTDLALVRWDGITGRLIQNSSVLLSDAGVFTRLQEGAVTLFDLPTIALDASLGSLFRIVSIGNRTLLAPTNAPPAGATQKLIISFQASGANRLLTLTTGAGGFRFGSTVTALTTTVINTTDYIGCLWNQPAARWDVVAYAKGF